MQSPAASIAPSGHWTPYFVSSDAQETREIVGRNLGPHSLVHRSSRRRPVTVSYRTASLGSLTLLEMAYSMFGEGEAKITVPSLASIYLCEINLEGEMAVGQRRATTPFRPGQIYMINANAAHAKLWRTDGRQLMIKIHQTEMEAALQRLTGAPVDAPLAFDTAPQSLAGPAAALGRMVELIGGDLHSDASVFARTGSASARQIILDLMLTVLPNNYSAALANPVPRIRPSHIRRAAEHIHRHSERPLALDDLVRASGVSRRTLHDGFRRHYGLPPMTYLRNVRLDRARLRLRELSSRDTTVTDVALACGFTHLGKFAEAYRNRFGELPSETLRNA